MLLERTGRRVQLSLGLTLAGIVVTEIARHGVGVPDIAAAGLFLLALVPIAYGALSAGLLIGLTGSLLLAVYALHYTGPHGVLLSFGEWPSFVVVLGIGVAMSYPMSVIHRREGAYRRAIGERNAALQRHNEELVEINAALESFGSIVSHDLKEPVRAIENYLSAAEEEWPREESRRYVAQAHAANERLARMLERLLEYSRASTVEPHVRPVELAVLVRSDQCRAMYQRVHDERGASLTLAEDLPRVLGDEILLAQIFGNLLLNAARHKPEGKPTIRTDTLPGTAAMAHVTVTDDGPGYPQEILSRFARLPERGAISLRGGFGLAIAQRAARKLGGELRIENVPEGGARAHVLLPRA